MRLLGRILALTVILALGLLTAIGLPLLAVTLLAAGAATVPVIVAVSPLVLIGVLCMLAFFAALGARLPAAGGRDRRGLSRDETEMVQSLHRGLARLEQRVETLEDILTEAERNSSRPTARHTGQEN